MSLPESGDIVKANIAIVLTDIIGSTKFVEKYGNLASAKWFKAHDKYCISLIYKFNGILCDASDGFLMYFSTVQNAIAFSFAYKSALKKHKFPFKTRIGIHYDEMLIIKTPQHLVEANHKRISLEGIGKSVAARTMSICSGEQVLLTHKACLQYKSRINQNSFISKDILLACGKSDEVLVIDADKLEVTKRIPNKEIPWGIVVYPKAMGSLDTVK